jgi:hypothetical protein
MTLTDRFKYDVIELSTMHSTPARREAKEKRQQANAWRQEIRTIEKLATIPPKAKEAMVRTREDEATKLEQEAADLQDQARLEDLNLWVMDKIETTKAGSKAYKYWMASWREGSKVRNVHLGCCRKMNKADALQKARETKAEALGNDERRSPSRRMIRGIGG